MSDSKAKTTEMEMAYPLCQRLSENREKGFAVREFWAWLKEEYDAESCLFDLPSIDTLWYEYLKINPNKLDEERRRMLNIQRQENEGHKRGTRPGSE